MIRNPVLPGFNPDPSFCRVGEDYYLATSTFEWYPGVQIQHSRDLVNWRLVARPLNRASLLDMRGNPDSCGVCPSLSHDGGRFWLVYTDVKRLDGSFKDAQFLWRQGGEWQPLGPELNAAVISDESGQGEHASFTGAFVGMLAMDLTGQGREARFARFGYWPQA